jgi:quercetin dioxygenase-like cupin family protein
MSSAASDVSSRQDTFWWQGSLMTVKARAEDTGGALGLVEARFYQGFGPPLHIHSREDEALYVLEGRIRFRQGDDEFVAGPGTWVWGPRGVPHAFKVESESARALVIVTPGGFERMFEEGGVPAADTVEPPEQEYDAEAAISISKRFGFEVVGPQLA